MSKICKLLLENKNLHNGHFQTEVVGLTLSKAVKLCKKLEKYTDNQSCFVIELWTEGDMTIYQKDYWGDGEHPLGHKDRMILGITNSKEV